MTRAYRRIDIAKVCCDFSAKNSAPHVLLRIQQWEGVSYVEVVSSGTKLAQLRNQRCRFYGCYHFSAVPI